VLRRRLSITEAATEASGRLVFGEPKTHRRRYVHLPRFVAEELAQHLQSRPPDPTPWSGRHRRADRRATTRIATECGTEPWLMRVSRGWHHMP
jgi:hypothetical protein